MSPLHVFASLSMHVLYNVLDTLGWVVGGIGGGVAGSRVPSGGWDPHFEDLWSNIARGNMEMNST